MVSFKKRVLTYSIFLFLLSTCGKKTLSKDGTSNKAIVLALTSVNSEGEPHFALVEKTYFSMNNLDNLDGKYLQILRGGDLTIKEVNGSIVVADSFSGGSSPRLRYKVEDGVAVALDYSTLAMLSGFYQLDYIYANVKEVLGIEPASLQAKLPGGKHTVLFEPQIKFKLSSAEGSAGIKLNAAFSPKDKQFLLFQRSGVENVPLSSNLLVLSHEFGHSVFDYAFLDGVYDEKNYLADSYAFRGLNEGWADFVSWNFTGSPDILRSSINIAEIASPRHITKTTFTWDQLVNQTLSEPIYDAAGEYAKCRNSFYCIGTLFARSLIAAQTSLTAVDKKTFANGIVESLKLAQNEIKAFPETIITTATENDKTDPDTSAKWTRQGILTGAFLRAIVKNAPADYKNTLCEKFIANFGVGGFPEVSQEGVCP